MAHVVTAILPSSNSVRIRLGVFTLDLDTRRLTDGEREVRPISRTSSQRSATRSATALALLCSSARPTDSATRSVARRSPSPTGWIGLDDPALLARVGRTPVSAGDWGEHPRTRSGRRSGPEGTLALWSWIVLWPGSRCEGPRRESGGCSGRRSPRRISLRPAASPGIFAGFLQECSGFMPRGVGDGTESPAKP
jgi:hypothetical protein